jgi:DNA-binding winged helix-turn-helix (wHTH) protein
VAYASLSAPESMDGANGSRLAAPSWTADFVPDDPLGSLQLVAAELAGPVSLERVAAVVSEAAAKAITAETILVAVPDEAGRHLRVVHESGLSTTARHRLPAILAAASCVLRRNGQAVAASLDSVAEALVRHAAWDTASAASGSPALAALIPPHDRALGIIFAGRTDGGTFSHGDRTFLNALAAISALALERLRLSSDPGHTRPTSRRQDGDGRFAGSNVQVGDMQIDLGDQEVALGDRRARLTPSELRILLFLAAEPGRVRTRREILQHLWHTEHVGDERACDAHISNLRRKIERNPARPNRVVTVRGVGYTLHLPRTGA